jgi:hypothetical protein
MRLSSHLLNARPPVRSAGLLSVTFIAAALAAILAAPVQARSGGRSAARAASSPRPGQWIRLGLEEELSTPAVLHLTNGNDLAVWLTPTTKANKHFYKVVELRPDGGMASAPSDAFGGHDWGSLTGTPTVVLDHGQPLILLEGGRDTVATDPYSRGCIVGDLLTSSGWKLQPWSLSANCVNPDHFGATITSNGTLSAAFPGGWVNGDGIRYRIGVAPTIPAATDDQHLSAAPGAAGFVSEATETHSQDVYAAWARFFSNPTSKDGVWVADLSKHPVPIKMPGTGTNDVGHQGPPIAMASPSVRGGIYVASCNNASTCSDVELWRYGAKTATTVPGSSNPTSVSLSAGPFGRLWIAWWSAKNGTVRVVRTNEAGNRFGPVETYAGPSGCPSDGNGYVRISGGSQQRADILLKCFGVISGSTYQSEAMATQSLAPLQLAETTNFIKMKKGGSVTFRVSDVGDAVQGAVVSGDNRKGVTDKKGQVTFHFPKGARAG